MLSFTQHMIESQIKEDPSRKAGNMQYQVAARLIAKHQGMSDHGAVLQDIERHFSDPRNTKFEHPESGVAVHRYSRSGEGVHDVSVKLPDGTHMNAEVVGGGGKMFASKRGIEKSEKSAGDFLSGENQHIISSIIRNGITRGELSEPETVSRITGGWRRLTTKHTTNKGTPEEKNFPGLVGRHEDGRHIAMAEIEDHMKSKGTTHWIIEGWKIPVGNLSHFIDRIAITQKDPHKEGQKSLIAPQIPHTRLALRGSGVRDPLSKEPKRKGGDTRWHVKLHDILKDYSEENLRKFKIEKL